MDEDILYIYGRKPPSYAVYRTPVRVVLQYADDLAEASRQRQTMARLNPLRGEINNLIDKWRSRSAKPHLQRKAERYDRRVGDALIVAFEDDISGALALLTDIKQDILDDRIAGARFEYLLSAFGIGLTTILFVLAVIAAGAPKGDVLDLWRAAAAGTVGAFFSIALAIRGRTVLPDLQRTANVMDAVLRMVIGFIAASVLMALTITKTVTIKLGDATVGTSGGKAWLVVLIVGFVAGFSERFVPDLLAKASASTDPRPLPPPAVPKPDAKTASVKGASTDPTSREAAPQTATAPPAEPEADPAPEQATTDHCACAIEIAPEELTPDEALPPATGGVAKPGAA